jgi:hypothetical protein
MRTLALFLALAGAVLLTLPSTSSAEGGGNSQLNQISQQVTQEVDRVGGTFGTVVGSILGLVGAVLVVMAFLQAFVHANMGRGGWYAMGAFFSFAVAGIVAVFTGGST